YACGPDGQDSWSGILYPANKRRLKLAWFLKEVVSQGLREGRVKRWPKRVYLIGHFSVADLPGFDDFDILKSEFDSIRRTFVTVMKGMSILVWDRDRHDHKMTLILRDSMLLAPGGKHSLKALGELVGLEKLQLAEGEIEN